MKKTLTVMILAAALCLGGCQRAGEYSGTESMPVWESTLTEESSTAESSADKKEKSSVSAESVPSKVEPSQLPVESSVQSSTESEEPVSRAESSTAVSEPPKVSQEPSKSVESSAEPKKRVIDEAIVYDLDSKYFINKLDPQLFHIFLQMYEAAQNFEDYVKFDELVYAEALDGLMLLLNYDCPELIQLNGDYSPMYADENCNTVSGVCFTYNMEKKEYDRCMGELHLFFENLKAELKGRNELEQEQYIYDMIFESCVYDDTEKYSGTVWGVLVHHVGRCEGICKAFMWCMRELDNECMCVSGRPKWEVNAVYAGHSWNVVRINGRYYQLDLTVDNLKNTAEEQTYPNYGFFNVDDTFCNQTHEVYGFYRELGMPECKSVRENYHQLHGLLVNDKVELKEQVTGILEKNLQDGVIDHVPIKFTNTALAEECYENIHDWIEEFLNAKGYKGEHSCIYDDICQTITVDAAVVPAEEEQEEEQEEEEAS